MSHLRRILLTIALLFATTEALGTGFGILNGSVSGVADANGQSFTSLSNTVQASFQVVPEPGTPWLIGVGALLLRARRRRK